MYDIKYPSINIKRSHEVQARSKIDVFPSAFTLKMTRSDFGFSSISDDRRLADSVYNNDLGNRYRSDIGNRCYSGVSVTEVFPIVDPISEKLQGPSPQYFILSRYAQYDIADCGTSHFALSCNQLADTNRCNDFTV